VIVRWSHVGGRAIQSFWEQKSEVDIKNSTEHTVPAVGPKNF
jgi:hypothetical protein